MSSYEEKMYSPLSKLVDVQKNHLTELEKKNRRLERERLNCVKTLRAVNKLNEQGRFEEAKHLCNGFLSGLGVSK